LIFAFFSIGIIFLNVAFEDRSMDIERAWQSALGQLQMEMPKASFDTWVRDSMPVSFENGVFTISVRNAYARDWLESRLSTTVTRLLAGIMNREISVRFAVIERDDETSEVAAKDETVTEAEPVHEEVIVEASYDLAYDEIVIPDHVTLVSRYFLRHLRLIGPELGWLYMAFRQAAFDAGARSGTRRERFSGKIIAAMSGITERTFWNRISKAETWKRLEGLVTTSAATPEWNLESAVPRRLPRKYTVAMTLPLTAADARSLRSWLMHSVERSGGPEKVIELATETPLDELLPKDAQAEEGDAPETVSVILRSLFGETIPIERLATLATRLHKHIMPDNDRLGVTHFFVEHILPFLGAGPGWMVTLIRDRAWSNPTTGEMRTKVRLSGGYAEIASWLGVTPDTVWRWLYGKHSESRGRGKSSGEGERSGGRKATEAGRLSFPVLSVYLRETTEGKAANFTTSPRTFEVLLDEIPSQILEAALDLEADRALTLALDNQANTSTLEAGCSRAVCSIGFARFAVSESPILARFAASEAPIFARFADDSRAVCSIVFARFADHLRAVCRVFKSLNYLNRIPNRDKYLPALITRESSENDNAGQKSGSRDVSLSDPVGEAWNLEELFKTWDVHPKTRDKLRSINPPAWTLVAWLIQGMTMRGLESPIHLAIARVLNRETRYQVNEDCEQLAKHPNSLLHEIKVVLHPYSSEYRSSDLGDLYRKLLGNDQPTATRLWQILTGQGTCEGRSVTREKIVTLSS